MKKFLQFQDTLRPEGSKTRRVLVSNQHGETLGDIEWYCHWRKYVFRVLMANSLFDATCLNEIQEYLTAMNSDHQQRLLERRQHDRRFRLVR